MSLPPSCPKRRSCTIIKFPSARLRHRLVWSSCLQKKQHCCCRRRRRRLALRDQLQPNRLLMSLATLRRAKEKKNPKQNKTHLNQNQGES